MVLIWNSIRKELRKRHDYKKLQFQCVPLAAAHALHRLSFRLLFYPICMYTHCDAEHKHSNNNWEEPRQCWQGQLEIHASSPAPIPVSKLLVPVTVQQYRHQAEHTKYKSRSPLHWHLTNIYFKIPGIQNDLFYCVLRCDFHYFAQKCTVPKRLEKT
jgi:hypothetical protein